MTGSQWNYDFGSYLVGDWTVVLDETTEVIENNVLKISRDDVFPAPPQILNLYQSNPDFSFSNGFILAISSKLEDGSQRPSTAAYVKVGGEWHLVSTYATDIATPSNLFQPFRDTELVARPAQVTGNSVGFELFGGTVWKWVALRFNQDTTIDVVYSLSTSHKIIPLPGEWITVTSAGNWSGGSIQEIGIVDSMITHHDPVGNIVDHHHYVSKIVLTSLDYDGKLAPEGIDQSIIDEIDEYYFRTALNGGGNAKFTVLNSYENILSSLLVAQLKKEITFNNRYENQAFRGEVGTLQEKIDTAVYEVEEVSRKTMFTRVAVSPIIFSTFLREWQGRDVIDKDAIWVSRGVEDTHIVSFLKADVKILSVIPIAASVTYVEEDYTTPFVPTYTLGSANLVYFPFDANFGTDDSDQGLVAGMESLPLMERWSAIFPHHVYEKYQNSIAKSPILYIQIAYYSKGTWFNTGDTGKPRVQIYDYTNTTWMEIDKISRNNINSDTVESEIAINGGFFTRTSPIAYSYDLEAQLVEKFGYDEWDNGDTYDEGDRVTYGGRLYSSLQDFNTNKTPTTEAAWWRLAIYDFLDPLDVASADDEFTKYEFKFLLQTANHATGVSSQPNGFWLFETKLTFEFLNDNEPEYSSTSINTVTEGTINLDVVSGFDLPAEDGFGSDDILNVSKSAKDYVEDAWAASGIDALANLDFQVTGADNFALTDDYSYKTFFDLLQDICSSLNATWWYDYPTATFVVRSVDLLDDSGVIIQASDVVGWDLGQWSIDHDATKERSSAIVIGDNVIVSKDFNPDHTFDLGDEVEIIDDSSIQTPTQARNLLNSIQPRRESPGTNVRFTLDFSDPNNNFAAVQRGKLITVQWPTTGSPTIANFSGSAKLLVISMEHNVNDETGGNEHVSITAQKRES